MRNKNNAINPSRMDIRGVTLLAFSLLGLSLHTAASAQPTPSRFQRCNTDVANIPDPARKVKLKECLNVRLEAERLVERSCRRQLASTTPVTAKPSGSAALGAGKPGAGGKAKATANAPDKTQLQKDCVSRGLKAHYAELPKYTKPKPASSDAAGTVAVAKPAAAADAKAPAVAKAPVAAKLASPAKPALADKPPVQAKPAAPAAKSSP